MRILFFFILIVLVSCNLQGDHREDNIKKDTITIVKYDTIYDGLPYACIGGVYGGKIPKGQLLHTSGIKLLNNKKDYKIVSFKCTDESSKNYGESFIVTNIGPVFNDKTIQLFQRLEANATLSIENIRAINKNNDTVILNSIIVHLPG